MSTSDPCPICPAIFDEQLSRFSLACRLCNKKITSSVQVLDHKCSVREIRERNKRQSGHDEQTRVCKEKNIEDHYRTCHKVVVPRDEDNDDDCQPLAKRRKKIIGKKDVSPKSSFYCHLCKMTFFCRSSFFIRADDVEEPSAKTHVDKTTEVPDVKIGEQSQGEQSSSDEVKEELTFEEEDVEFYLRSQETKDPPELILDKEEEEEDTIGDDAFETEEDYLEDFADGDFYEEEEEKDEDEDSNDRVKCNRCDRTYKNTHHLHRHSVKVHGRRGCHVCRLCQKTLRSPDSLCVHMKLVHPTDMMKCHRCDYTSTLNELTQHVLNVHNRRRKKDRAAEMTPSVCHLCQKVLKNDYCLFTHLRYVHSTERATCDQCQATFKSSRIMREHVLRVHKKNKAARARKCMNLGRRLADAQLSAKTDEEEGVVADVKEDKPQETTSSTEADAKAVVDQSVKCQQCGKSSCNDETCYEILAMRHGLQIKCPHCEFRSSGSKVSWHVRKVHEMKTEVYICSICGKEFKSRSGLTRHIDGAHQTDASSSSNICETCGGIFASSQCLADHIKILHRVNDDVMNKCPQCDYVANRPYRIRSHVRRIHEKIKSPNNNKVVCQICGVTIRDKKFLAGHIKSKHEGEIVMDEKTGKRIFPCKICGQKCGNRNGLTMHMSVKHGVVKLKKGGGSGRGRGRPTYAEMRKKKEGEDKEDESILSESAGAVLF